MTVTFIVDYYPSTNSGVQYGGAEISIALLAKNLAKKGIRVKIAAPSAIFWDKYGRLFPEWFVSSPIWFLFSSIAIYLQLKRKPTDIIHVQGKNVFLGAVLANLFLQKPLVITVRDYRLLCDLGMCLLHGNRVCNFNQYFQADIPTFVRKYTKGAAINFSYAYLVGTYQMALRGLYRLALAKVDKIICISRAQEEIFNQAGFANTTAIYNIGKLDIYPGTRLKQALYGGRYTLGKGKDILEAVIQQFLKKYPDWKFLIVGRGETKIKHKNLQILGQIPWAKLRQVIAQSSFVVTPSVWPEPFGRSALDAISMGTPVLTSDRGGLPEIVTDERFGLVTKATSQAFISGLEEMVAKHKNFSSQIAAASKELKVKFGSQPTAQHLAVYKKLL